MSQHSDWQLDVLLRNTAALLAVAEQCCPHMNGPNAARFANTLDDIKRNPTQLDPTDETWIREGAAEAKRAARVKLWANELRRLAADGVRVINCTSADYPTNLTMIHDRPPILFIRGTVSSDDKRAIAIVGTRNASAEGAALAEEISCTLSSRGITIVSGLAKAPGRSGSRTWEARVPRRAARRPARVGARDDGTSPRDCPSKP